MNWTHKRRCICCGRQFLTKSANGQKCEDCKELALLKSVYAKWSSKVCVCCGTEYQGPDRSVRCPPCIAAGRPVPKPKKGYAGKCSQCEKQARKIYDGLCSTCAKGVRTKLVKCPSCGCERQVNLQQTRTKGFTGRCVPCANALQGEKMRRKFQSDERLSNLEKSIITKGHSIEINGCVLKPTATRILVDGKMIARCPDWFTCPNMESCLDATAANNWPGFRRVS